MTLKIQEGLRGAVTAQDTVAPRTSLVRDQQPLLQLRMELTILKSQRAWSEAAWVQRDLQSQTSHSGESGITVLRGGGCG
ncbi:hypothetical protein FKM82_022513 [Ascaphus truei]